MPIPGKVEKIKDGKVYFRHESGKLYATHAGNLRKEEVELEEADMSNKEKKKEYVRQVGLKAMKQGKVDPARGHSPQRFGREILRGAAADRAVRKAMEKEMRRMGEEAELDEGRMKNIATDQEETARLAAQEKETPFTPDKKKVRRGLGGPMSQAKWLAKQAMMKKRKEMGMKEEVEQTDEAVRVKDISVSNTLGSLKKAKPGANFIAKDRAQMSRDIAADEVKGIRKKTMGNPEARKAALKRADYAIAKEDVELIEQDDTMEKKEMAQTQLHFMQYAAKEILEFIAMGGQIEEWYQNKLSKVHSDMEGLHSYIEGEKRRTGMVREEVDQIDEKLDPVGKEDKDIDNDGDSDKTDVYLATKRKAIGKAIKDRLAKKLGK
jgi:hypothetical protein